MGNINKTIEQLERKNYGVPNPDEVSYLEWRVCTLRKKIIADFTTEDLRIMIGQNEGLPWLIPIALEVLKQNPLAEGDYYPGDLLYSVINCDEDFWKHYPAEQSIMAELVKEVSVKIMNIDIDNGLRRKIERALNDFN